MEYKECTKCRAEKTVTEFYLDSRTRKPRSRCKACVLEASKEYYDATPEYQHTRSAQWRADNPEYGKAWRDEHQELIREYDNNRYLTGGKRYKDKTRTR